MAVDCHLLGSAERDVRCGLGMMAVAPVGIECVIRAQSDSDVLRLEAVVLSNTPVAGQYSFVVAKRSATGSSNNSQSGTFALKKGPEQVVSTLVLDRSA